MANVGRPTDYDDSIIDKSRQYIDSCEDTTEDNGRTKVKLPSIEGLAVFLKVTRTAIYDWKDKYPEFYYILEELLSKQAEKLLSNGLGGQYNSTITKLILTKHGYSDKIEVPTDASKPLVSKIVREVVTK